MEPGSSVSRFRHYMPHCSWVARRVPSMPFPHHCIYFWIAELDSCELECALFPWGGASVCAFSTPQNTALVWNHIMIRGTDLADFNRNVGARVTFFWEVFARVHTRRSCVERSLKPP